MSTGPLQSLWAKKTQAQQPAGCTAEDTAQPLKDSGNLPREKLNLAQTGSTKPLQDSLSDKDSAASEKSGKQSSGVSSEQSSVSKKRKRAPFTLQQKEKLGAAFARTHYPTAAEYLALSAETRLDKTQIANWFDHARRKRSRLGGAIGRNVQPTAQPARGPAGSSVVVLDDDEEEELPEAAGSAALPDEPQRQQHQADGSLRPNVAACANDVPEPMDTDPCEEQQPDAGAGHPAAASVNSVPGAAVDMEPVAVTASGATAAAGVQPEAGVGPANSEEPLWSAAWCADQRAHYQREMDRLSAAVEEQPPLRPLPEQPLMALNKSQLASLLAGCVHPIGSLLELLHHESVPFSKEALRNCIIDIATRKNFAPKEGKGADIVVALSDEAAGSLWRWELRNLHFLPKGLQPEYKQLKKFLQEAGNLLTALHGVCRALQDVEAGKSRAKAEKALARLAKLPAPALLQKQREEGGVESPRSSLPQQDFAGPSTSQLLASPRVSQLPALGGSPAGRAQDAADKELQRQARQAERERHLQEREAQRKEKEAEKERLRQEKAAQKAEKEAQWERRRLEKEKEKEQQKQERKLKQELAGFGSVTTIQKSRNALTRFFKKTPAAALTSVAAATPHSSSPIKIRNLEATLSPHQEVAVREAAEARTARIDAELTRLKASPESARENRRSLLERWKLAPRHRRLTGLPPTWARRLQATAQPLDFEDDEVSCETWRRKFLWFPAEADASGFFTPQPHWPPYYGSWSKSSKVISPRRPFARDPQLDYDFMEDEEWEPEPEGENLSADEADEEDVGLEDSANDGFFVSDGQLSDDEGVSSVQQDIDELCAEQEEDAACGPAEGVDQNSAASEAQRRLLEAALRKSLPRPLIISRLPTAADVSGYSGCLCGDGSLLSALSMQVVAANVRIEVPAGLEEGLEEELAAPGSGGGGRPGRPSGPAGERPQELVPDLIRFLQAHPEIKAVPKLVQAFCDAWPERKLVKNWIASKVKEMADRGVAGWRIKPEALAAAGMEIPEAAAALTQPAALEGSPEDPTESSLKKAAAAGSMLKFVGKGKQPSQAALRQGPVHLIDNGSKQAASQAIKGTSDPQWKALVDSLVQPASSYTEEKVSRLFSAFSRMDSTAAVPAFVPIAMLKTLGSCGAPMILRESCARNLAMLVTLMASAPQQPKSPPHKVWGEARSAPKSASLEDLFAETKLRTTVLDCIQSPNIDLAKSAAMLLGALVSIGSPQKLGVASEEAEPREVPMGVSLAATAFRSEIAGEAKWVNLLTTIEEKSATMASYRMLALCHLLHDEMCIDSLLEEPCMYNRVLLQCLISASSNWHGCAKYGLPGLTCLVRWHETVDIPFGAAVSGSQLPGPRPTLERLLLVLLRRVEDRSHSLAGKDRKADNLKVLAMEVARVLGETQHKLCKPIASNEGNTAEERRLRDDLLAALAVQRSGPESVGQQAAQRAWEALMRC